MKKNKESSSWRYVLWDLFGEIILFLAVFSIGLGIAVLFPHETVKNTPAEIFFILGGVVLCFVVGIVSLTVHFVKQKKKNKDTKFIYNTLKSKYKLILMLITKSVNGETHDFLTIKGQSSKGKFELYKDGEKFNLFIVYFGKTNEDKYRREIIDDKMEAINCIQIFMSE